MTNGQIVEQLRKYVRDMEAGFTLHPNAFTVLHEAADAIDRLNDQTNHMDRMMTMLEHENAVLKNDRRNLP